MESIACKSDEKWTSIVHGSVFWCTLFCYSRGHFFISQGLNGLHLSAKNGHFDCLKYLVNNSDLDIDTLSEQSKASPLHYSVQVKNGTKMYQCMKLLLDKGADHRM